MNRRARLGAMEAVITMDRPRLHSHESDDSVDALIARKMARQFSVIVDPIRSREPSPVLSASEELLLDAMQAEDLRLLDSLD